MNKVWKIGTDIASYVNEVNTWKEKYGNEFVIRHPKTTKGIEFVFPNGEKETKTKSTASQFMRVLLTLGFIDGNVNVYPMDRSVLREQKYNIISLNSSEMVGDFIASNLGSRVEAIYKDGSDNKMYPSEDKLVFSILATFFSQINPKTRKILDLRIESSSMLDIEKYYLTIVGWINDSISKDTLYEKTVEYIVGFNEETSKVVESISGEISNNTSVMFSEVNLEEQIIPDPLTFGMFMDGYFAKKTNIVIPVYQRKYIWPQSTVRTLLNDIKRINKGTTHYLGNIIVKQGHDGTTQLYRIIDGQQRITTLTLIAKALFDFAKYKNMPVDRTFNSKMALDENNDNMIIKAFQRVKGNNDYDAFKIVMRGNAFSEDAKSFPSQIIENYKTILNWLSLNITSFEQMNEFWKNLLNRTTMVIINAKASEEYKLFEKLNTGAVPLTTLELFKNYILDVFTKDGVKDDIAQKLFEADIESKFAVNSKDKEIEKFIITYLRVNNSSIGSETIFNQFKDLIELKFIDNNPDFNLSDVLKELGSEIDLYIEISNYKNYNSSSSFANLYSDFLYMFDGRTVYFPIIIKLIKMHMNDYKNPTIDEINLLREYFRILEIFEVRLQVAVYRGQSLSTKVEQILFALDENVTPADLWKLISKGTGSSTGLATIDQLREALENSPISNKPARLIMTRLENYEILKDNWKVDEDTKFAAMYNKPSQREHLLPSEWSEFWGEYLAKTSGKSGDELKEYVNKYINFVGNAFPIPAWSNNDVKHTSLANKTKKFNASNYSKLVKMFSGIKGELTGVDDKFNVETIRTRSKEIAKIATEIWKDYK